MPELFLPLLDAGCRIDIPGVNTMWSHNNRYTVKQDLMDLLGTHIDNDAHGILSTPIVIVRKMQVQGYKLSTNDKDIFIQGALQKFPAYKEELSSYSIPFQIPSENDIKKMISLQEPLSLMAQSRICIRRKLMERGNNLYRTVKELDLPRFVEEIILMEDGNELMKCILQFGDLEFFKHMRWCNEEESRISMQRYAAAIWDDDITENLGDGGIDDTDSESSMDAVLCASDAEWDVYATSNRGSNLRHNHNNAVSA